MNSATLLNNFARQRSNAPAIIDTYWGQPRTTTFTHLQQRAGQVAALLQQSGVRAGDHVLVLQPMSAELYCTLVALLQLGMVAVFLDPSAGSDYIEHCCALCKPRGLIASAKGHLLRLLSPALRRIPHQFVVGPPMLGATSWSRARGLAPLLDAVSCDPAAPALLTFTSGSTGAPKAAVRSHGFLLTQHEVLTRSLRRDPEAIDLTTLPIVVLANLASGTTSVIPNVDLRRPGAVNPAPLVAQLHQHAVTSITASPALLGRVAQYCCRRGVVLSNLRTVYCGGGPLLPQLLDELQALAPAAEVVAVYGSTEAEPIAVLSWQAVSASDRCAIASGDGLLAGPPIAEIELRVMRNDWGLPTVMLDEQTFAARCCPAHQPGEIVVSGSHVLKGYLHGHGDNESKVRVGNTVWHRTGDAGYLDTAGRLWLLGRCAARIDDLHGQLYPFVVEVVAAQAQGVGRAAVVAMHGKRIVVVEPDRRRGRLDIRSLRAALSFAAIDEVVICKKIPVDARHNAKIDYAALRHVLDLQSGSARAAGNSSSRQPPQGQM
jgi:olefin beta-lactone synthetase